MTQQNYQKRRRPLAPPPELVEQWDHECESDVEAAEYLASKAAQWGYQQAVQEFQEFLDSN